MKGAPEVSEMNSASAPPFRKALPVLVTLLAAAWAGAQGPTVAPVAGSRATASAPPLVGAWRLHVPEELRRLAGQVNLGDVSAEMTFKTNGSFQYVADGAKKSTYRGRYTVLGSGFVLERFRSNDPWPEAWPDQPRGSLESAASLTLEGLGYERSGGELMIGVWVLEGDKGTRFELRKDGSFFFQSLGTKAQSKGRWDVHGDRLELQYTEVDGEKVEFEMRSKADVANAYDMFVVSGRFRYVRSG